MEHMVAMDGRQAAVFSIRNLAIRLLRLNFLLQISQKNIYSPLPLSDIAAK